MRASSIPRKIVLPEGQLQRFRLPEGGDPTPAEPRPRRLRIVGWVALWAAFTWVGFQWSEGRIGPRSWVEPALTWMKEWRPPETPRTEPRPVMLPAASSREAAADLAAVVAAPKLTAAPKAPLTVHGGSFEFSGAREEVPSTSPGIPAPPADIELESSSSDDSMTVVAGPGCERAKLRYRESFLDETEDERSLAMLGDARRYSHCRAELMSLTLCALVHRGEAIGVTVQSEPPNRVVSTCAAIVAKTAKYPRSQRPQLLRTEIYFQ